MAVFKKQIFVCVKEGEGFCGSKGGMEVFKKFREVSRDLGISSEILVTQAGCTGQHSTGPTVMVHPDGVWYQTVTVDDVGEIMKEHVVAGQPVERLKNATMCVCPETPAAQSS